MTTSKNRAAAVAAAVECGEARSEPVLHFRSCSEVATYLELKSLKS